MVRLKNRYIVVEINPEAPHHATTAFQPLKINENTLNSQILDTVQQLHGDFGVAAVRSGFRAKYCNELTHIAIVRCRQGPHKLVTSVLPFVTYIDTHKVIFNTLYIGATMRNCFNFVRLYQQRKCDEYCTNVKTEEELRCVRNALVDLKAILNAIGN
ncbi:ribonuclease P/MRP protein subunit POP5 [Euwallacea fornicatus]|uniref:ribonuclease P/MRP protein subunit POP5 n=1 Tax=Euwallacea fornicatus TaxID=995702 RepID=UPI0033906E7C